MGDTATTPEGSQLYMNASEQTPVYDLGVTGRWAAGGGH